MFNIKGSDIFLTRGDTAYIQLSLKQNGQTYEPSQGDVIRFAVKKKYTDETAIINKQIPTDTLLLHIEPSDTATLGMNDIYVYDMELTDALGNVDTFIGGKLTILPEVM